VIAALGRVLILVALLSATAGAVAGFATGRGGSASGWAWTRRFAYAFAILMAAANALMVYALLTHDFSVSYVAHVGSRVVPTWVSVVSLWSSLEGSILFWGLILGAYVAAATYANGDRYPEYMPYATAVWLACGAFFSFLLSGPAQPFLTLNPAPSDGPGPNPLLQNHYLVTSPESHLAVNDWVYTAIGGAGLVTIASLLHTFVTSADPIARQRAKVVAAGVVLAAFVPSLGLFSIVVAKMEIPMNFLAPFYVLFPLSIAYAIGYAGMGWFSDKVGVRLGLAAAAFSGVGLAVGGLVEKSIPALVVPRGQMKTNLLGMSFLDRLESWGVQADKVMLHGYPDVAGRHKRRAAAN
jgi:cytochrome c biogenesis factor